MLGIYGNNQFSQISLEVFTESISLDLAQNFSQNLQKSSCKDI